MQMVLVQHGEAKTEAQDPERPLTDRGVEDVKRVAEWASSSPATPTRQSFGSGTRAWCVLAVGTADGPSIGVYRRSRCGDVVNQSR